MFLEKHLNFVRKSKFLSKATFVFNECSEVSNDEIKTMVGDDAHLIFRPNIQCSYGAWQEAVLKNLNRFDYHFLIEDDYLPVSGHFFVPFLQKMTDNVCYVASGIKQDRNGQFANPSNGLLSNEKAKIIFEKRNCLFDLSPASAETCNHHQIHFLNYLMDYFDMKAVRSTAIFEHSWGFEAIGEGPLLPVLPINWLSKYVKLI